MQVDDLWSSLSFGPPYPPRAIVLGGVYFGYFFWCPPPECEVRPPLRPKLPDFTCTYVRLHLYRNPVATVVQVSPLACLVNKERVGLCAPKDVRRPGFGEGRERIGMLGQYSEKMVSKDTVNAALHMGGTATSRPSPCSRHHRLGKANSLAQRPSEGC